MRRCPRSTALAGLLLVLVAACTKPGAPELQGTWKGTKVDGVGSDAQTSANAFAAQIQLEVKGDVITVTYPKDQKQTGHYTVKRADKSTLVISADKDGPTSEETFTFVDDKTMKWSVDQGRAITFVRKD